MKLSSINHRIILETVQDQIQSVADKSGLSLEEVSNVAKEVGLKHWKWVLNQWHKGGIDLPSDSEKVSELIVGFEKVKSKLDIKDINQYKSILDLESNVKPLFDIKSSKKKREHSNLDGVEVVDKKGPYTTLKVSDPDSLSKLGIGTKWCTRGDHPECRSKGYITKYGHIFVVLQNGRPTMQYTPDYNEVMDINNDYVEDPKMLSLIPKPEINDDNANVINNYIRKVLSGRWPEAEPYIMKNMGVEYAIYVVKGRWLEAEPYIMKDPMSAFEYAMHIIKGRWPEAEPYIMKDPSIALEYATEIIGGRWPEAEPYIMKENSTIIHYAWNVIKGRWPEAEPHILKSPKACVMYAKHIIEGRWPEAEEIIMQDPEAIYSYVINVIQYRWHEAEPHIMKNKRLADAYNRYIDL